jgi:Flp pilus assembly protein TadG
MLMPAAVLVLFILGAITFDYAHLYLAKRELQAAAESAANDAVTFGVDQAAVRRGRGIDLDDQLVVQAVEASLAAHGAGLHLVAPPDVERVGATQVRVTVAAASTSHSSAPCRGLPVRASSVCHRWRPWSTDRYSPSSAICISTTSSIFRTLSNS